MNQPKVQIVIPVYNAEKYLRKCLDSLKAQTYTNWEAILIDDASTDASARIISEYKAVDDRFTVVFLEENQGVSKVRNIALSMLNEKYTAFLDSDDYWESDMLELMVGRAEEKDFDICQCRFIYDYPGGRQVLPGGAFESDTELDVSGMKKVFFKMATGINMNHVCMKLVRTRLIGDLRFNTTLKTAEDLEFCVNLFTRVRRYCFINKPMYHYCRNEDSLTGKGLGGREKLKANRYVARVMVKALPQWGLDSIWWKALCLSRPYVIILSKIFRNIREKLFSVK